MAIKARAALGPYWYTPASEAESSNPTRFHLKPLNGFEKQDVQLYRDANGLWRSDSNSVRTILGYAVLDWENVLDEAGKPLKFNVKNKAESLGMLPEILLLDLFFDVFSKSTLTEDQEKN